MAASMSDASTLIERGAEERLFVFDRRIGKQSHELIINFNDIKSFDDFHSKIKDEFVIGDSEDYIVTTTNREPLRTGKQWSHINGGDTLYILSNVDQELSAQTQERVNYLPHYDTIVKGGMYEYYASSGHNPLPYAFAELIDNSLSATADNGGPRNIEISLHLDESNPNKNVLFVLDNGKGMTSRQLNNWAVYRLSKFIRNNKKGHLPDEKEEEEEKEKKEAAPRSLNSDISYFGVGGKQAIFFIGSSCRMVTKCKEDKDVHELTISKEEFEEKEKNKEAIYSGFIRNRKPGDASHIGSDEEILCSAVGEEANKENFTLVVVNGITPSHVQFLKNNLSQWTRQLAHIYHYYLHGPNGNVEDFPQDADSQDSVDIKNDSFSKLNIEVKLFAGASKLVRSVNLREIDDDMQSQYIRTASNVFEFKATVEGTGIVEGVLRYHPFLYDRETYPSDANDMRAEADAEDDHDYTVSDVQPARGKRPIFECFWNGRLIPYTFIEELDWCGVPKKAKTVPLDCFNRLSGVLWTNDKFQVSTNKLTFIDLEVKLREKHTAYSKVLGKNDKRTDISKEFQTWLQQCHEKCDKQVMFSKYIGTLTRPELPKYKQNPWSTYKKIEWGNKVFKEGDLVRITKLVPHIYGTVNKFILYGIHEGDVFATGGEVEVVQEPKSLYDEVKVYPLHKLDRTVQTATVKQLVEEEENKLPDKLLVTWPEGHEVKEGQKLLAGKPIGDIKIQILNRKKDFINKLPGQSQKKLLVEMKIIWHGGNKKDEIIIHHISQHGKTWPYWFKRMVGVVKNLGDYTLQLQTTVNESGAETFADRPLPSHTIHFSVIEAEAEKFSIGMLEGPFKIGEPFNVPLQFHDEYGHVTKPTKDTYKPVIEASGLELKYNDLQVKGNSLLIKAITALGSIPTGSGATGKSFNMVVKIENLEESTQTMKVRMLPGVPHTLIVSPEETMEVENGKEVKFNVKVLDKAGNLCYQPKLIVNCQFVGVTHLPTYHADCSHSGEATLTAGPIDLPTLNKNHTIKTKLDVQGHKSIGVVERVVKMLPSNRACVLEVWYDKDGKATKIKGDLTVEAGSQLEGLTFKVFDEAGNEKDIDDSLASKIKVNWAPKHKDNHDLVQGILPKIKLPLSVNDTKYCSVSVNDGSGVEFSFNIKPVAGEPSKLKCSLVGESQVRMGETLQADILVSITDAHGNKIKKIEKSALSAVQVSGDGLMVASIEKSLRPTDGFSINGIKFEPCALGSRELVITWNDLKDYVRVEVLAGPPANLLLVGWDLTQPVTMYNNHTLSKSLVVQLVDKQGNETTGSNVRIQLAKAQGIKLIPSPEPIRTDKHGKADFGKLQITGKQGVYEIQPKAFMGRTTLSGPKLKISIQPDADKPTHMEVEFEHEKAYRVDETFPVFTVRVYSEEGSLLSSASAADLTMTLSKVNQTKAHARYLPDAKRKNDKAGVFTFSKAKIPEERGMYNLWFEFENDKGQIRHDEDDVVIEAGPPVKLETKTIVGTPTVSNTEKQACRVILTNLNLELKDAYGNTAGENITGKVLLQIVCANPSVTELPCFVGNTRKLHLNLSRSKASFSSLILQENCSGKDGQEYILKFTVESNDIPKNQQIPAFEIPFLFYNDSKKQAQSAALSKERDNLNAAIRTYKSLFDTTQQLIDELQISLKDAQTEENKLKAELRKSGIMASRLVDTMAVDAEVARIEDAKESALREKRRMCGLQPAPQDAQVLGKIAHLAHVIDDDIARVMSWHMSADMDCVVTLSTKKAKDIYKMTNGKQQVLPLDSIFKKNLPDWNKPLPHERIRAGWYPTGNPVYARNCLQFPKDDTNCKIVFGMLLGDTIILDNLDDANTYRQEIVKHTHCPTILTRDGDRIRSNGKFGGLMNKALPVEKLRGAVFSQPLSAKYNTCCQQIELLQRYTSAVEKREQAETDLQDQRDIQTTPEMQAKYKECTEAQGQLGEIETRLGLVTPSTNTTPQQQKRKSSPALSKDSRSNTTVTLEPVIKRNRTSSPGKSSAVNGSNINTPLSPTRQSGRRSALSDPRLSSEKKRTRRN